MASATQTVLKFTGEDPVRMATIGGHLDLKFNDGSVMIAAMTVAHAFEMLGAEDTWFSNGGRARMIAISASTPTSLKPLQARLHVIALNLQPHTGIQMPQLCPRKHVILI